jgi:transcriptional regulator with XRE-family HTH domain
MCIKNPIEIIDTDDIVRLLDATRAKHRLTNDDQLGRLLGVSGQAIYRWRRGQISRSARILATLMRENEQSTAA